MNTRLSLHSLSARPKYFDGSRTRVSNALVARRRRSFCILAATGATLAVVPPRVLPSGVMVPARAQNSFRFSLRAEPDIIAANGISTTSISVNVENTNKAGITATPIVRFVTTAGTIEPQARLEGGVARVLLRSSNKPGTAVVTAIIGASREQIAIEFSGDDVSLARYLQISGAYVAYGAQNGQVTSSGSCIFDYGDLHIESDVRLDVDLNAERVWAEGGYGHVLIRNGSGKNAHELRGDRLYYDLRRRRGVMRRADASLGPARQEFMDSDFKPLPAGAAAALPDAAAIADVIGATATPLTAPSVQSSAPDTTIPAAPLEAHQSTLLSPQAQTGAAAEAAPIVPAPNLAAESALDAAAIVDAPLVAAPEVSAPQNDITQTSLPAVAAPNNSEATAPETQIAFQRTPLVAQIEAQMALEAADKAANPADEKRDDRTQQSGVRLDGSRLALLPPDRGAEGDGATGATTDGTLPNVPDYRPLPEAMPPAEGAKGAAQSTLERARQQISEPMPPAVETRNGYWVVAKKMRVFPRRQVQFERTSVFFNGRKLFSMPRYVASLNSSFSPATDILSFNSAGGPTLNFPYYYQASPRGTGTLYIQRAPGGGFAAEKPGFALALDQQYWLSDRSQGRLIADQLGRGGWNLNWQHKMQFSPTMRGEMYLDAPRHRNIYLRSTLLKEYRALQLGFEGLMSRPSGSASNAQGQFFARLRPRTLGNSGWSYTLAANVLAVRRFSRFAAIDPTNPDAPSNPTGGGKPTNAGGGTRPGGVGLPGRPRRGSLQAIANEAAFFNDRMPGDSTAAVATRTTLVRPLIGQTLLSTFQSPSTRLWRGATAQASVLANLFNYSDGRRGFSPGFNVGLQQNLGRIGSFQLDYNYDRGGSGLSNVGLLNGSYSNFVSGSLQLNFGQKLGGNAYFTKSLTDGAIYGAGSLDFYPLPKWRLGLYSDYSQFDNIDAYLDYGLSLGRQIGQREVTLNWSRSRNRIYFELGNMPY